VSVVRGTTVKLAIELFESSGPVSPRFQYTYRVRVECTEAGGTLAVERTGAGAVKTDRTIDGAEAAKLVADLDAAGARTCGGDFVGALRGRKGISFNWLELRFDDEAPVRVDYVLTSLDDEAFAPQKRVLDVVKALGAA
jgi:hypothetical protein